MRSHGCDACGAVTETRAKTPTGWASIRFVRYGHRPASFQLCASCASDLEHLLTGTRRGQTRIHRHLEGPP